MKNKFLALVVVLVSFIGLNANAQFKVGGGLAYATDINGLGFSLNGTYAFTDQIEAAPSFTYYFKKDYVSWWSIDLAGHYNFISDDSKALYGLAGLEILGVKVEIPSFGGYGGGSASDSKIGLVLGGGGRMSLTDKLAGFGELKLGIVDGSYIGFNFGVLYSL
jgi:hypothetical protein